MAISEVLATIDNEIAKLQQVKVLLGGGASPVARKVGRPKRVVAAVSPVEQPAKKKRSLSLAARKRIATSQKARWAAKKAAAK